MLPPFYPDVSWNNAEDCLSGSRFIQFTSSRKHLTPALDSAALLRAEEGGTPMCLLPEPPQPIFLQLGTWKKEPRTSLCFCFGPSCSHSLEETSLHYLMKNWATKPLILS
ncbi:PREDICTED: uncharacterized protein LOC105535714 [Mandrillus leucophaeus]|uniref:uncharacterized protein LOC105535714 n=1 Tax=Mandrillus leucophaeus TaxID=9568 RepID=UPI0005F4F3C4|nr:PREDICTED: uncharacterized protein LOC105535714 [Mandrillus leucophaeus]